VLNKEWTLGLSIYGNGGLNTSYTTPIPLFGRTNAGVDLSQLFIAPTATYKLAPDHALGLALNIAFQRFEATGLENFDNPVSSQSPGNVTNNGYDNSWGFGVRIGYAGKLTDSFTVGATYQSKTSMQKFDKYKGLFANQGEFDIPANFGVGFAWKPVPAATLAFDVVRIQYSSIDSIGNPLLPNLTLAQLGASGGPGFGWDDVTAYKFGVDYAFNNAFTLRAGYNYGKQPIPESETLFNILAPGVVESHYTLGGTWNLDKSNELNFAFMYAPKVTVNGTGAIPTAVLFQGLLPPGYVPPNGNADISLQEFSFGVSWGWKF
jgi:long-chain fatty acid transport protein